MIHREWSKWGATVQGPTHQKAGLPNQDSWIVKQFVWGDIAVVADGLGSRPHSDVGSYAACQAVVEASKVFIGNRIAESELFLRLIHNIWLMKIAPLNPEDCLTTCVLAIRMRNELFLAQIGDGMIVVSDANRESSLVTNDDKEDSFSNLTHSLGRKFILEQWQTFALEGCDPNAIILCTDGISDDLLPERRLAFAETVHLTYRDYSPMSRTKSIHKWLREWPVPGHSDDKTIVCLYKNSEGHHS